jgi:hypothetical protein
LLKTSTLVLIAPGLLSVAVSVKPAKLSAEEERAVSAEPHAAGDLDPSSSAL